MIAQYRTFPPPSGSRLIETLTEAGYDVIGPRVTDGAITFGPLRSFDDLPVGVGDRQRPGRYELRRDDDHRTYFAYAVGPHSLKTRLHPSRSAVWDITRAEDGSLTIDPAEPEPRPLAVIGVRSCELAALKRQDRVLLGGPHTDTRYATNRHGLVVVVVNCNTPAGTCFCASMGTGPTAGDGYDIALTEIPGPAGSIFLARAGTGVGRSLLDAIPTDPATEDHLHAAADLAERARDQMRGEIDLEVTGIRLRDHLEDPGWDEIAERCLACGNCTSVCPTCFCTDMVDTTSLDGTVSHRERVWDTCFNRSFSLLGPGPVRASVASRYRQWLVHKFSTWHDQFGESGCVGCGRCITWCPVGIDVRAEVARIGRAPRR